MAKSSSESHAEDAIPYAKEEKGKESGSSGVGQKPKQNNVRQAAYRQDQREKDNDDSSGGFGSRLSKVFGGPKDGLTKKKSNLRFTLQNLSLPHDFDSYRILSNYSVGPCSVHIATDSTGKTVYLVSEPPVGRTGKYVYSRIMNYLFVSLSSELPSQKNLQGFVRRRILEISKELELFSPASKLIDQLQYYTIRDAFGYGIIDVLMKDPNIEDVVEESYYRPVGVAHKDFGEYGILDTNISFRSLEAANSFVQRLVQRTGKSLTAALPYVDSMTKEGHRVAATFGKEVSLPGPNFTIRKFSEEPYTITKLIELGTINIMMAAYVWLLLEAKSFLLVIGATSAGKTTTIGALSSMINPQAKVTTIEDTPELKMGHMHWQRLVTRKSSSLFETKYEVTMDDLIRLSLRSRPDYIVVGEVRGAEISSLIQAVSTGHGGLTSFHAFDANSAFVRMESPPMNVHVGGQMLISAILRQNRFIDESGKAVRKVTELTEILSKGNRIELNKVFKWNATAKEFEPRNVEELVKNSVRLQEIASINGWSNDELTSQLVMRMCFLSKMIANGSVTFDYVTEDLARFYYDPLERFRAVLETRSLDEMYGSDSGEDEKKDSCYYYDQSTNQMID